MGVIDGRGWPFFGRTFLWGGTPTKIKKFWVQLFVNKRIGTTSITTKSLLLQPLFWPGWFLESTSTAATRSTTKWLWCALIQLILTKLIVFLENSVIFFLPFDYLIMWGGGDQLSPDNEEYWEGEEEGEDQARHGEEEGGFWEVVMYGLQGVHHADIPLHRQGDSHAHWHHQRTLSKTLCTGFIFKTC